MKKLLPVLLVGLLLSCGKVAATQELDVVGSWHGQSRSQVQPGATLEWSLELVGNRCSGEVRGYRGYFAFEGTWAMSEGAVLCKARFTEGTGDVRGNALTLTLTPIGQELQGTWYSELLKRSDPMSFKRAK
jgi:hypothetical protein